MRKGDKRKKVFGLILILAIIVSVFGGVVSAEDVSAGLKQSVDNAEIETAVREGLVKPLVHISRMFVLWAE